MKIRVDTINILPQVRTSIRFIFDYSAILLVGCLLKFRGSVKMVALNRLFVVGSFQMFDF